MATSMQQSFEYKVQLPADHIRLLTLLPGEGNNVIECNLHDFPLATCPAYTAVSYTWDEPLPLRPILLNGKRFNIRENLWLFLGNYRDPIGLSVLWIDAICINQGDVIERNAQVLLIGTIFAGAEEVAVWLGRHDAHSKIAMDVFKRQAIFRNTDLSVMEEPRVRYSGSGYRISVTWSSPQSTAIRNLFTRAYWRRLWVVQEFLVAKKLRIHCGNSTVPLDVVEEIVTDSGSRLHFQEASLATPAELLFQMRRTWSRRRNKFRLIELVVMDYLRKAEASLPHDRVYALLGLLTNNAQDDSTDDTDRGIPLSSEEYVARILDDHYESHVQWPAQTVPLVIEYRKSLRELSFDVFEHDFGGCHLQTLQFDWSYHYSQFFNVDKLKRVLGFDYYEYRSRFGGSTIRQYYSIITSNLNVPHEVYLHELADMVPRNSTFKSDLLAVGEVKQADVFRRYWHTVGVGRWRISDSDALGKIVNSKSTLILSLQYRAQERYLLYQQQSDGPGFQTPSFVLSDAGRDATSECGYLRWQEVPSTGTKTELRWTSVGEVDVLLTSTNDLYAYVIVASFLSDSSPPSIRPSDLLFSITPGNQAIHSHYTSATGYDTGGGLLSIDGVPCLHVLSFREAQDKHYRLVSIARMCFVGSVFELGMMNLQSSDERAETPQKGTLELDSIALFGLLNGFRRTNYAGSKNAALADRDEMERRWLSNDLEQRQKAEKSV